MNRGLRWTLVAVLLVASGSVITPTASLALGPVRAVSVDDVVARPNDPLTYVFHPTISTRGEAVTFHDVEVKENGVVRYAPAPVSRVGDGYGTAISGNGCVTAWVQVAVNPAPFEEMAIGTTDVCSGASRELARTPYYYDDLVPLVISANGQFALVSIPSEPITIDVAGTAVAPPVTPPPLFPPIVAPAQVPPSGLPVLFGPAVFRIDLQSGAVREMPDVPNYPRPYAHFGMDLSDDGQTAVVPVYGNDANVRELAIWDLPTNGVALATPPSVGGTTMYPSLSATGRHLAFSATKALTNTERGRGPWVYVLDRATGATVRVSGQSDSAYYASLSGDATQVAYAVAAAPCTGPDVSWPLSLESSCRTTRIDVAFGPNPGLGGASVETISLDVNGRSSGLHAAPQLSGNGRWITWVSTSGNALLGQNRPILNQRQSFLRRRDASLSVDSLAFGPQLAGTQATQAATIRNTGRTSVNLDQIEVGGPGFASVGGGTCAQGLVLGPGQTCTVNVRFTAPATPGDYAGTVTARETGYDPVAVTPGTLTGRSTSLPPITTTTTTTTTTTVPGTPTTTSTTTTVPGQVLLDINPKLIDFGPIAVGSASAPQTITVTNVGNRPALLTTTMSGATPDDFFVSQNGCVGITLDVGASCTLDVLIAPLAGGDRGATLTIAVPGVGDDSVTLIGQGRFTPRLLTSPAAITERGLTTIIGQFFPNDLPVTVIVGDSGVAVTVTPDVDGEFRIPLSAFPSLGLGSYIVRVDARPGTYELTQTLLVVQLATFQPQGPGGAAFGDTILVTRGG